MEPERLRSLVGFEGLSPAALRTAAARARRLELPARRWLVRPGRALSDHYYLLQGRVRLLHGGRCAEIVAASARARHPVYPGAAGLETLTPAVFASIHPGVLDALRAAPEAGALGVPEIRVGDTSWQHRFLGSPLMQRLAPLAWQRVLRAMTSHDCDAGQVIVAAGESADCCYVLCAGAAEIRTRDRHGPVARLAPGSLFGEDALVTGGVRNASVLMATAGRVVSLPAPCFERWLLDAVVRPLEGAGRRRLLSLSDSAEATALAVPLRDLRAVAQRLPRDQRYAVVGGDRRERLLASFLLAERGIDARPLLD